MGGSDDAHIGFDRLMSADAIKIAIGQYPQQTCLQVGRHIPDLIKEQRAAFGLFEASAPCRCRAGECTALMTEQFRFEQVLGMAAVLMAMNGLSARGLCRCSACATNSLPVPDSPLISTVACDCDNLPMARNTSCIAGAWPEYVPHPAPLARFGDLRRLCSSARRISSIAWLTSNGLGRYSKPRPEMPRRHFPDRNTRS